MGYVAAPEDDEPISEPEAASKRTTALLRLAVKRLEDYPCTGLADAPRAAWDEDGTMSVSVYTAARERLRKASGKEALDLVPNVDALSVARKAVG